MLHTKGNLVNTSHPGCESRTAVEAEWSESGRGDFCDYSGVVTLFPKGERAVTTWRLYKRLMPSATHTQNLTAHPLKWDEK